MAEGENKGFEIDYDKLGAAVAKAVQPMIGETIKPLAEAQKVIADTMAADAQRASAAGAGDKKDGDGAGKTLTLTPEEFDKRVAEQAGKLVDQRLNDQRTSAEQAATRTAFINDKLKDLPETYQAKLGNDPQKWKDEEQAIRNQLKADYAKLGVTLPDVGGDRAGQGNPASAAGNRVATGSLTEGQAKYAGELKIPGRATA